METKPLREAWLKKKWSHGRYTCRRSVCTVILVSSLSRISRSGFVISFVEIYSENMVLFLKSEDNTCHYFLRQSFNARESRRAPAGHMVMTSHGAPRPKYATVLSNLIQIWLIFCVIPGGTGFIWDNIVLNIVNWA